MKKYLLLFIVTIVFASCEKDNTESINGSWMLTAVDGGYRIAGPNTEVYTNGDDIIFTGSSYKKYSKGQLVKSGTFSLVRENSFENRVLDRIIYDNSQSDLKEYVEAKKGKLTIYYAGPVSGDGLIYSYNRGNLAIQDK